ncbi:prophage LambdaMc01, DNA primase, P4 family [Methylococcus capsulatus str. Bath]|uniref:Prophage LambdaMc01, DNA primase, P4 family n=1 Tax=Methylococcus capsulatus (strain ATCC 33009 / NCIMB 11132 / Bath) TaxID=243233 RepID=Q603Z8_METCA|nr:phage/plasmid primase, P4 family [Methylococcus capsulatus]AAU91228.1 prophage LambdaMc01, DNA primase, P4 family [Methylococcus capsulatus str. Bath]
MIDFNDIPQPEAQDRQARREEIRAALLARLESVLFALLPAGKKRGGKFLIGDVLGSPGDSLEVVLDGEKAGLWTDRATGDGGDIFGLIAAHLGADVHADFPRVLDVAADLVGRAHPAPPRKARSAPPVDGLGPATAKWDYFDPAGKLIAVVYRYDPPGRKKEFRPWDARRRKMAPPEPRPLYNQPGLVAADTVVLVEGEKCAQALIDIGVAATTAMHGANAPVDKTDWSPLAGKAVLIWPDRDKPGWEYAMAAAQAALAVGAMSCDVLLPPDDRSEGWDAADAVAEGFDVAGFLAFGPRMSIKPASVTPTQEPSVWATDDALALAFTSRYAEDWRYCAAWGKWLVWDGRRWQADETLLVHHLIRAICREAALKADSHRLAAKLAASSTVGGVERLARTDRRHASTSEEWDADLFALNTPSGIVDLKTGRIKPHDRRERMTKLATATPHGDCARWRAFLEDITGGDTALQAYLQRMVGYCLTGATSAHALFFLYGTGANGKSVFVNTLATILGDYATSAPMDTFMEARGDRHPTDLAGLRGARFVSSIETEQGRRWNESKVKAITGGDKVSARFMRQDFFEYLPQFKLVIAGNHKPAIRNVDEAMKRRLHLIPFTVTIPPEKRDGQLTEKLLAERDGILAWAVEGCLAWQRDGLNPPASVVSATEEYFDEEDAIGDFLDEEAQRFEQARVAVADVFQRWQEWATRRGEYVGTSRWLAQQLANRGFGRARLHGGVKGLAGLSLKPRDYGTRLPYRDD